MLEDLGKLIAAKGFKKLPKVQKIARSGHTAIELQMNYSKEYKKLLLKTTNHRSS